jgi:3-keto-5-aminohexanoate cleavage enzyme
VKLIVNLAPTGMVPTRAMTPHVPLSPAEIVADVTACAAEGITTVHVHGRDEHGDPTTSKEVYAEIIAGIRDNLPEVVICVTTSGRNFPDLESRSRVLELDGDVKPDMASLTLASLNFARSASVNSPDVVRGLAERMRDRGIKPELEIFDLGMANYARYLIDKGVLEPPFYANLFFGNVASAQATLLEMGVVVAALPPGCVWSLAGIGNAQLPVTATAIAAGAGIRIGLEDNIWFDAGRTVLATNPGLVRRAAELGRVHEREVMTSPEFRRLLSLAGAPDAAARAPA